MQPIHTFPPIQAHGYWGGAQAGGEGKVYGLKVQGAGVGQILNLPRRGAIEDAWIQVRIVDVTGALIWDGEIKPHFFGPHENKPGCPEFRGQGIEAFMRRRGQVLPWLPRQNPHYVMTYRGGGTFVLD